MLLHHLGTAALHHIQNSRVSGTEEKALSNITFVTGSEFLRSLKDA